MCGIAGIIELGGGRAHRAPAAEAMLPALYERGPDASGVWRGDGVQLAHRRLRIIDLSADADQPFRSRSGNEVVVYNGEIYNHRSLRRDLEGKGHRFRTRSDTEVLIHGYQEWGDSLVPRLSGMFAFALWDVRRRRLLLARDRVGKKPLYYAALNGRFLFASNVKALLAVLPATPDVDYQALYEYLGLFGIPEGRSVFEGVRRLPPAHLGVVSADAEGDARLRLSRYWTPRLEPKISWSEEEVLDRVDHTLRASVRRRLESDVPLAVFLSGGIDSSLVTAYAARELPRVTTISARFEDARHDEGEFARAVANRYATDHREVSVKSGSLDVVPELIWQYGEPFSDSSAIAQYLISRATKPHATVVLTGDGGDELFGGYRRYTLAAPQIWLRHHLPEGWLRAGASLSRNSARPGSALSRMLTLAERATGASVGGLRNPVRAALASLDSENPPYFLFHTWFLDRERLISPDFRARREASAAGNDGLLPVPDVGIPIEEAQSPFDALLLADLAYWLPADMLTKVDVATMAASLEARSPLLDRDMVELAAVLHWRAKVGPRRLKKALRLLAERHLPPQVAAKRKWGFVVPVGEWMRGPQHELFREVLVGRTARDRGLFDYDYVARILQEHRAGRAGHKHRLWSLFCLELWFRMFVDGTLDRDDDLKASFGRAALP